MADASCAFDTHANTKNRRVVLVMQGGGALGAFQAGVYEAMEQSGYIPEWIGGTSMGAINGTIIAGNRPEHRLERLKKFWDMVSQPDLFHTYEGMTDTIKQFYMAMQLQSLIFSGVPVFFRPQIFSLLSLMQGSFQSFYDTSPLRDLLNELVDFDYLNQGHIRLSLGATNLNSGKIRYFDSKFERIGPEHVLASGALPATFPPVLIEGQYYWDGGIYSNTPLSTVLDDYPRASSLCFMVELWSPEGKLPTNLDEIRKRNLEIIYSSRYEEHRKNYEVLHNLRRAILDLYEQLPPEKKALPDIQELRSLGCFTSMDIVQLQYQQQSWESSFKDSDFTASTIQARWQQGKKQTEDVIKKNSFSIPHAPHVGVVIHRWNE